MAETGEKKREELGVQLLENCRNELYSIFPYLDGAFASLPYVPDGKGAGVSTLGEAIHFSPTWLTAQYGRSPVRVRRGYLHMLLHCLFFHLFRPPEWTADLWNVACDLAVEQMIEREAIARLALPPHPVREACFRILGDSGLAAEDIAARLAGGGFPFPLEEIAAAFAFDDHGPWSQLEKGVGGVRRTWERIAAYTGKNRQRQSRRAGTRAGTGRESVEPGRGSGYDYRRFLQRFTTPREEVELDLESFDYVYYHYGLERYGNMPLIEPLEYREVNRLEELVIAIDTSGSCSAETVRRFLEETYSILSAKESFFHRMKVYLLQCDCCVQDAVVIHSQREWAEYSKKIEIQGRGGTDFRPVFRYIQKLRERKELRRLKALIYFTDGDGIYPRERPDYETAFVMLRGTEKTDRVPDWALHLLVG